VNTAYATVVDNRRLYANTYLTWFRSQELVNGAYPGQFLMLRCADEGSADNTQPAVALSASSDPLLPRPMSYHRIRIAGDGATEWSILYDVVGRGTAWLAARQAGDRVYAWGPLGNGYKVGRESNNLLLVAGGIGIAPLVWLAEEQVARGRSVTLIIGARDADHVFPITSLPSEVEVVVCTDDGSAGRKAFATEPFAELVEWCDQAFACGPTPMFRTMAEVARRANIRRSVQVLLEERMGCGTGICYGCAIQVRSRGATQMKLICKDGPRVEVRDVVW